MPPTTSVVVVNFNAGEELADCVRSALASPETLEVVVVDNRSSDGSPAALRAALGSHARLRLRENAANLGFARASNQGLAEAKGEYVLFLNPDCVVRADTLTRMRSAMEAHPRAGLGGGLILNPDGTEQAGCRRAVPTPWRAAVRAFGLSRLFPNHQRLFDDFVLRGSALPAGPVELEAISGAFMFARRAAIEEVGPLDEGYFLHCEDLDWCMRFRQQGWSVLFVPDAVAVHDKGRCSRGRPLRVLWHMHRGMIRFYRKFFRSQYPAPLMWAVVAGVLVRFSALGLAALLRQLRPARPA